MPRYIAILFALPLLFASCEIYNKNKPTEFFKIEEKWLESYNTNTKEHFISGKRESFVLSNYPKDTSLLEKIIDEYNERTISVDTIKKYRRIDRMFYRETKCLTRNYEEGKPYPKLHWWIGLWLSSCSFYYGFSDSQELRNHNSGEGYLMYISCSSCSIDSNYCNCSYEFGGKKHSTSDYKHKIIKIGHCGEYGMENC